MYRDKLSQEAVKANRMYGDKVRATLYRDGNWVNGFHLLIMNYFSFSFLSLIVLTRYKV